MKGSTLDGAEFHETAMVQEMWHIIGHLNGNAICESFCLIKPLRMYFQVEKVKLGSTNRVSVYTRFKSVPENIFSRCPGSRRIP